MKPISGACSLKHLLQRLSPYFLISPWEFLHLRHCLEPCPYFLGWLNHTLSWPIVCCFFFLLDTRVPTLPQRTCGRERKSDICACAKCTCSFPIWGSFNMAIVWHCVHILLFIYPQVCTLGAKCRTAELQWRMSVHMTLWRPWQSG